MCLYFVDTCIRYHHTVYVNEIVPWSDRVWSRHPAYHSDSWKHVRILTDVYPRSITPKIFQSNHFEQIYCLMVKYVSCGSYIFQGSALCNNRIRPGIVLKCSQYGLLFGSNKMWNSKLNLGSEKKLCSIIFILALGIVLLPIAIGISWGIYGWTGIGNAALYLSCYLIKSLK